ncbi:CRAL/TRIO domain-containing protein [Anopheles darlingi]|uniref:CRAL/TRIO domain-containing protein n=1 Tax=Anopheles darlingi TaxID=43151 RepID=W5JLI4_ANODA|nr:CRAL/TRIO domain-containing protein [Anopheles darlingi]
MASLKFDDNKVPYLDLGKGYRIALENTEFTDAKSKEKAARELRETPEVVEKSMAELRTLLQAEKTLYIPMEDDPFMIKFLRPCKYYAQSAFELIQRYYRFRMKHPDLCDELYPSSAKHVYAEGLVHFLPLRDQHGSRILVLECGKKWKPSIVSLNDLFRAVQIALEAGMYEPRTQLNGAVVILDMEGLALSQIMQFTPKFAAMVLDWIQQCVAMRLKSVHIVNNSYLFNMLFAIFKPFITEKLRKRLFFHQKDWSSLMTHIDAKCLRPKYGGTLECLETDGALLGEMFELYHKEYELANSFGYLRKKD